MLIISYILATLVGISLGLLGAGGSILTVPILVYVLGIPPVLATGYSLFIVGITALIGTLGYLQNKLVSLRIALLFAVPSFSTVFLVRRLLLPLIPTKILDLGFYVLTKESFLMLFFATLLFFAANAMIGRKEDDNIKKAVSFNYALIFLIAVGVGFMAGLVGAGGGFIIIPALVLIANVPMRMAVGTSLLIIASNSLIGFMGDLKNLETQIDWRFLLLFSTWAVVGIFIGTYLAQKISPKKLRKQFGYFLVVIGIYILSQELF